MVEIRSGVDVYKHLFFRVIGFDNILGYFQDFKSTVKAGDLELIIVDEFFYDG